jgi:tetratricopeptide (TPR) repeat protein
VAKTSKSRKNRSVQDRLKRAQRFYSAQRFSAAAREASSILDHIPPGVDFSWRDSAAILALFAYARAGEFEAGWQLVPAAADSAAVYLDFCYAACYLAYQKGDYENTEVWGRRYLDRYTVADRKHPHNNTHSKKHEILNTLGCAAKDRGDDSGAVEYLEAARELAPDYPLSYLNLAMVYRRSGQTDQAEATLSAGLQHCGNSEELRLYKDGILTERTISLCMIVKNEEAMLPEALASVKGVVSEIIVVDTGSTDGTVAIAESFGARVFHHAWEDDFSKARNQSISYATSDWILILDADERLVESTSPLVRKLAQSCLQEAVSFSVYNIDLDSDHVSFLPSVRMFRNGRGYLYKGIVHNQIDLPTDTPVMRAPVRIDHYGYTPSVAENRGKYERTTTLLQKQLDRNPDDAFAHFNMAQIMRGGEEGKARAPQIVEHARRVVDLIAPSDTDHLHILLMGYHQLATAYFNMADYRAAADACAQALKIKPDYIDALMTLGHTHSQLASYTDARETFLEYLRVREGFDEGQETRGFILLNLHTEHQAWYGLGIVEEATGQLALALEWYRKVLARDAKYLDTQVRIGRICYALDRYDEARLAFCAQLLHEPEDFWSQFCLGDLAVRAGQWAEAYDFYTAAYVLKPDNPHLPLNLAACAFHTDQPELATRHLASVTADILEQPAALRLAGDIAMCAGETDTARRHYEKFLESDPDDGTVWSDLGNTHYRAQEWHKALTCYDQALERSPELSVARRNRALVYLKQRKTNLACRELTEYVSASEADLDAVRLLADLLAEAGHHPQALGLYERYLREIPGDRDTLFRLSNSYHAMGQQDAAVLGYQHLLSVDPDYEPAKTALASLQTS